MTGRPLSISYIVGVVALVAAALLGSVSVAYGWTVTPSADRRTVVVERGSLDTTAQVGVWVYTGYKNVLPVPNYTSLDDTVGATASYNVTRIYYATVGYPVVEVPIGQGPCMVRVCLVSPFTTLQKWLVIGGGAVDASWQPQASVNATVTALPGTVPVSLEDTMAVSIDSTLPVTLQGIGETSGAAFEFVMIALGALLGLAVYGAFARVWGAS